MDQVKAVIYQEVAKHGKALDKHHVEEISSAIFKQLSEYIEVSQMAILVDEMQGEFLKMVDSLIPIVEEYEAQIDEILDIHMGKLVAKI